MEKRRRKPSITIPLLLCLSLAVNYGQFSGWVTIQNPATEKAAGYQTAQRAAVDLLVMDDLGQEYPEGRKQ